jgi:hypothetical protein
MKKILGMVLCTLVAASSITLVACSENAAATAKCKDSHDSDSCSKCCTENGASGNTYTGSGCTCRGGG